MTSSNENLRACPEMSAPKPKRRTGGMQAAPPETSAKDVLAPGDGRVEPAPFDRTAIEAAYARMDAADAARGRFKQHPPQLRAKLALGDSD